MENATMTFYIASALILSMLLFYEIGRRLGLRAGSIGSKGTTAAQGAVFTILGLLIAFTFSGAAERFELRRHLIVEEANAIGTAYLRLDLLPAATQEPLREQFRRYTALRASLYNTGERQMLPARLAEVAAMQDAIWQNAGRAVSRPDAPPAATMLLLPALNSMFDLAATRQAKRDSHPPSVIFAMLGVLSLLAAALVGFDSAEARKRSWFHTLAFCTVIAATAYVILDLEYPRNGLITIDQADSILHELRASM
jgi:hypothetical protein